MVGTEQAPTARPFARVAVALPPREHFTYRIPVPLMGVLDSGHAVVVPFGPRSVTAYVLEVTDTADCEESRIRDIQRLLDPEPVFDSVQLALFQWIANYYLASLGEVIATALPSAFKGRSRTVYRPTDGGIEALATHAISGVGAEVLREVIARPGLTRRGLQRRLRDLVEPDDTSRFLDSLHRAEQVSTEQVEPAAPGSMVKVVRLVLEPSAISDRLTRPGARQRAVLEALQNSGGVMDLPDLVSAQGPYARSALKRLVSLGIVNEELREFRDAVSVGELPDELAPPSLTQQQSAAVAAILGPPQSWLLFGVTGSGKTEVYLRCAAKILDRGKQVLVLVPEIGLTPQLTGRFRARFGERVAVLHSGLSSTQRLREWRRIRAGEAQIAVGARSALFAPFSDLGMVVVDEEHDDSYKQDDGVRYSARDMAVVRAHLADCPVVLGSATPSMETFTNALEKRYGLLELTTRPTPREVPDIEHIDMRTVEAIDGKRPLIAPRLHSALSAAFEAGGKAIVLFNRRGYATFVQCTSCGGSYECPSCGVSLVLHQAQRTLSCHYCGFHRPYTRQCPHCQGELEVLGRGTEQVEEVLAEMFPQIPVGRMDADTTRGKGAHHRLLEEFSCGKIRLLVGTQMVAKGHDFPDVHVAAVIGADHVLRMPDFRAAERTFSLLTQLAGRAGRGDVAGQVFVQTHHPEHYALQTLGDFRAFYAAELRGRNLLAYPPLSRLVLLRIEGARKEDALQAAFELANRLRGGVDGKRIQVLGPAPAALPRLVGRWRFQVLVRGADKKALRQWLDSTEIGLERARRVRLAIDVDPRHLM